MFRFIDFLSLALYFTVLEYSTSTHYDLQRYLQPFGKDYYRLKRRTLTLLLSRWSSSRQYFLTLNHCRISLHYDSQTIALYITVLEYSAAHDSWLLSLLATVLEYICMCANTPIYTPRFSPIERIGLPRSKAISRGLSSSSSVSRMNLTRRLSAFYRRRRTRS